MELNKLESEMLIEFYDTDMLPEMPFEIEYCKLIEKDTFDKIIHDANDQYLINHNDDQNIKDIEDLIFGDDDELNETDRIEIVSQR